MQYSLTCLEIHRRLTDGRLIITGIHKKPFDHPVELVIEDLSNSPTFAGHVPSGLAYLVRYTSIPADEWDACGEWDNAKLDQLEELLIDPEEIYWLSLWAEALWDQDDDSIEIAEEPTSEVITSCWSSEGKLHLRVEPERRRGRPGRWN